MDDPTAFRAATRVWMRVAAQSFGGPAGQIAVMHRIVVEEKRWVPEAQFLHALGFCTLLPGPEAQQLATYLGWLLHGVRGGLVAGVLFIVPGFVALLGLSLVYAAFGDVGWVAAAFFGLKAAVLAIVLQAVVRLGRRAVRTVATRAVAGVAFVALFGFALPFPLVVLVAGGLGAAFFRGAVLPGGEVALPSRAAHRPLVVAGVWLALWLFPVALLLAVAGPSSSYGRIAVFFSQMAVVGFGGAYAVLAYVAQQAVDSYHWLRPGEMLDGLGLAETTPGPLIMVLEFVGFMAAFRQPGGLPPLLGGVAGAVIATWVTFVPCFLWIFLGAPYVERLRGTRAAQGALAAITAAVAGVILNLAVWFAIHTLFRAVVPVRGWLHLDVPVVSSLDGGAALLAVVAAVAVFGFRVGAGWVLAGAAVAGVVMRGVTGS